jgi:uracil-DNA glycosylase
VKSLSEKPARRTAADTAAAPAPSTKAASVKAPRQPRVAEPPASLVTKPVSRSRYPGADKFFPPDPTSLPQLRTAVQGCRGCDLYKHATQAVFGEGPKGAKVILVGEQPGDREDVEGRPFVGPAGGLLSKALAEAGIERSEVYVTNAVKHFKWTPSPRGKKRLHSKPSGGQTSACRPWLEAEIHVLKPQVLVTLGATAAQSLMGSAFRVTQRRGEVIRDSGWAPALVATVHPSAILRAPDEASRRRDYAAFVSDLRKAAKVIGAV